ncbi:BZ3500_MvSof-1268-A1-R1_Chr4-1g06779 [Microbotryum saponariae]|uniref:BZ3500_MvSof-1268-A1-R1_Chr4-1g06779 protein n=1 Tax=Microbotryum saponariae TaxID=289078 RepID=A0A2X0NKD4_9BASI|nr:BZ3500_MvSof-1268-A1-R1_Chr4-1g06779 [Microbotryum saponariae]SDA06436.1 BZ3501_MvSof-1269-A2-R1_Chr4-1g06481 [Microbotryum saponariae]
MAHDFLVDHSKTSMDDYLPDLANMATVLATGILSHNCPMNQEAIDFSITENGKAQLSTAYIFSTMTVPGRFKRGRATLDMALVDAIAHIACKQGGHLFVYDNSRLHAEAEYVVKYNLGSDVVYRSGRHIQRNLNNGIDAGGGSYAPDLGGFDQLGLTTLMYAIKECVLSWLYYRQDCGEGGTKPSKSEAEPVAWIWDAWAKLRSHAACRPPKPDGPSNIEVPATTEDYACGDPLGNRRNKMSRGSRLTSV